MIPAIFISRFVAREQRNARRSSTLRHRCLDLPEAMQSLWCFIVAVNAYLRDD